VDDEQQDAAARPLAGLLVVDVSRHLPGPLVGRILGDLGARVLKVEEPRSGDPSRQAPPLAGGRSGLATLLLAGHESVALDLKKAPARAVLDRLLERADVLVESFRPGTLARFGLAPQDLRRRHPRLVVCSLSGWGQEGPWAQRSGHDLTYQAVAGSLASRPAMPAVPVADVAGAWSAATAVLAALYRRRRSGEGCWIDQALLDAAGHAYVTGWAGEADGPKAIGEPLPLTGALLGYGLYRTRDGGYLALAALEPKFWRAFCIAVGRRDWIPRILSRDPRLRRELSALIAGRSGEEWAALLAEHDVPGEPLLSAAEARRHPQVKARDLLRDGADGLPRLAYPALFDGRRPRAGERLPPLGADTDAVLAAFDAQPPRRRRGDGIGRRRSLLTYLRGLLLRLLTRRR